MKFVWEEKDIKPVDAAGLSFLGAIIENTFTTASNRFSILGYEYSGNTKLFTIVRLDDGGKITSLQLSAMVHHLNENGYAPVTDPRRLRFG